LAAGLEMWGLFTGKVTAGINITSSNLLATATTLNNLRSNNLIKNIYATGASLANVLTLKSNHQGSISSNHWRKAQMNWLTKYDNISFTNTTEPNLTSTHNQLEIMQNVNTQCSTL
jgi:hypothetical protein